MRQAKRETGSLVDENHTRRRSLPNQVKRREGSTYPSTDDCDCRGWFFPCSHDSTLGRNCHQRNSQILMPYKQALDIDSKSSSLIRHHFYCLDMAACVDQNWISKRRNTMNNIIKPTLALGLVVTAAVLTTSPAEAEIHSRSKDLVVIESRDLSEQPHPPGNLLFLDSENAVNTHLYVHHHQAVLQSFFYFMDPPLVNFR